MRSVQTRYMLAVAVLVAIASGAIALLLFGPRSAPAAPATPQVVALAASTTSNTITVVGSGSASAAPDEGTLNVGVSATRPSVRDAVSQATTDMNHLLGALHSQGVQDKDIQTSWLAINQQNNCCPQSVTGYTSSNQVTVTIHHLQNATGIMEAAVDAVGNDLQLSGINLGIADTSGITKSARSAAMSDANARAQDWARLAGHHIGGLIDLSEVIAPSQSPYVGLGKGGAGGGVPIEIGQMSVTVAVTATYELLP
ncbi:MAG: SIMPL domain-containing protein [Candidatus Dormibacteraceae bacterium]